MKLKRMALIVSILLIFNFFIFQLTTDPEPWNIKPKIKLYSTDPEPLRFNSINNLYATDPEPWNISPKGLA